MKKGPINLVVKIAGKDYTFSIEPHKEELYAQVGRHINAMIAKYLKRNIENFEMQDALALAAFELAITQLKQRQNEALSGEQMDQLRQLDLRISDYLNDPSNE